MAKLSRKDKFKDLRSTIDLDAEQSEKKAAPRPNKPVRLAAPDNKGDHRKENPEALSPIIEDVLGEVSQYNKDNGDLTGEDAQMQILYDLSEDTRANQKRSEHLEVMEANEEAGGTTKNIYGSDFSAVQNTAAQAQPAALQAAAETPAQTAADTQDNLKISAEGTEIDWDDLDIIFPGVRKTAQETAEEEQPAEKKSRRTFFGQKAKSRKPRPEQRIEPPVELTEETQEIEVPAEPAPTIEEIHESIVEEPVFEEPQSATARRLEARKHEEESPASKASTIFMIVCSVILVILIILTIYWMSKLGIF